MIQHLDTLKTGISDSGVNLTQDKFLNLTLPIPPVLEQREIARRVDQLFSLADQIEYRYATAKRYVDGLKQSILSKAFRGELLPQDPNDEPASVLLERIRKACESQQFDTRLKPGRPRAPGVKRRQA
jgi:type I restriction enzyme, S subunit